MKIISLLAILSTTLSFADPLIILPVGDSITQGGKRTREEYSYRLPLQRILNEKGIAYDFIGSQSDGLHTDATWPDVAEGVPFDPDHEGYYGNRTRAVVDKVMEAWQDDTPVPDVVLIHLGTNDQNHPPYSDTIAEPLEEFVMFLREKNPEVIILIGHLNFNGGKAKTGIRPVVEELAETLNRKTSPVLTVHHYRGWHENPKHPETDTYDWAHPNPQGQKKMAEAWWEVMKPLLQNRS